MKTFKTAVIGCGMISKNHFKALKNVENAECVVACDIRPERAAAAAETYGIPHTETEYHRVLDNPEIDAVHICLPHYLHAQVAIEAMEHGKHVLCEKPMALDPADAEKMIEVRDRTGRTLGICFPEPLQRFVQVYAQPDGFGQDGQGSGGTGRCVLEPKPRILYRI